MSRRHKRWMSEPHLDRTRDGRQDDGEYEMIRYARQRYKSQPGGKSISVGHTPIGSKAETNSLNTPRAYDAHLVAASFNV